ncbi:MAG: DUF4160 domain-containing protein [Sphaerochaetaceae bacterium]|nr:DUF4160 domain-containing protein [Sphaerochaetaceae bacterium]MDD3163207.1 DUF4160 domain-containing protein [Sphaerochaetaceae bacterium]MDD4007618.1 DUF4160 domain-containing protein [Sphaerochaetaceae bacterium]
MSEVYPKPQALGKTLSLTATVIHAILINKEKILPELSRFYGIVIKMLYDDSGQHSKPHFHVFFGEYSALIGINGELIAGGLPSKQLKLVQAWAIIHEEQLYRAWNNAVKGIPFEKIEPLK